MSSKRSRNLLGLVLTTLALTVVVDPALARDASSSDVGKGLGQMLQGWAKGLIPGVIALAGIPAIARHAFGMAVSIFIVAMLLGAFAFIPADQFKTMVDPIID